MTRVYHHPITVTYTRSEDARDALHARHAPDVARGSAAQTVDAADVANVAEAEEMAPPAPVAFRWRSDDFRVQAVLSSWHLQDRWWEKEERAAAGAAGVAGAAAGAPARWGAADPGLDGPSAGPSDRTYYRLDATRVGGGRENVLTCEIYHDAVSGIWVLERVYD
jgi:hypothetical protein